MLMQTLVDNQAELGLSTEHFGILLDNLFVKTYDSYSEDPDTTQRMRQTRAKLIASLMGLTEKGAGDSRPHQDWSAPCTLVLALSISCAPYGKVVLAKLSPEYLRKPSGSTADRMRQHAGVGEMTYDCGGEAGTALTMMADENDGWMHATRLRLDDLMRLMVQVTCMVLYGKAPAVMAIWRRVLLGKEVQGEWNAATE